MVSNAAHSCPSSSSDTTGIAKSKSCFLMRSKMCIRDRDACCYFQVTADMTSEETFSREMRPLESIRDNYEKTVLTLDRFTAGNYNGIKVINVIDWLLNP